jgi:hypothetical protein
MTVIMVRTTTMTAEMVTAVAVAFLLAAVMVM